MTGYTVVVEMWLTDTGRTEIDDYEAAVEPRMSHHGGRIVSAFEPSEAAGDSNVADLVHVLVFPGEDAFAAYLADPQRQALASRRDRIIARTRVRGGADL